MVWKGRRSIRARMENGVHDEEKENMQKGKTRWLIFYVGKIVSGAVL